MPVKIPLKSRRRFSFKLTRSVFQSIANTAIKISPGKPFSFHFNNDSEQWRKMECLFILSPQNQKVYLYFFLNGSFEFCCTNSFSKFIFLLPGAHPVGQRAVVTPVLSRFFFRVRGKQNIGKNHSKEKP